MYAQVDVKPKKKPTAHPRDPKPPQEVGGVEYASIAYQPEDAAVKSQQAADASPKPKKKKVKKHVDAGMHVRSGDQVASLPGSPKPVPKLLSTPKSGETLGTSLQPEHEGSESLMVSFLT